MNVETVLTEAKSILSPATGFIQAFDWTCNPYRGCQFGCFYCYAQFSFSNHRPREEWGRWVEAKMNAVELLRKKRKLRGASIYMSSVTDPYQPIEKHLLLTRGILTALLDHQPRLVIQTRGPLVARDLDLLTRFDHLRVNFTLGTDDDAVRRRFEPSCASVEKRLETITTLRRAGVKVGLTATPLLPIRDVGAFGKRVAGLGLSPVVTQFFHAGSQGWGAAHTGGAAWQIANEYGWNEEAYIRTVEQLREELPDLLEGQSGFVPV